MAVRPLKARRMSWGPRARWTRTPAGNPIIVSLSDAGLRDEVGGERDPPIMGDDDAQPALELHAHLGVGAVGDLDLDEGHVGDAPRLGHGVLGHPAGVGPRRVVRED